MKKFLVALCITLFFHSICFAWTSSDPNDFMPIKNSVWKFSHDGKVDTIGIYDVHDSSDPEVIVGCYSLDIKKVGIIQYSDTFGPIIYDDTCYYCIIPVDQTTSHVYLFSVSGVAAIGKYCFYNINDQYDVELSTMVGYRYSDLPSDQNQPTEQNKSHSSDSGGDSSSFGCFISSISLLN